ncbi:hypothetical protein U737_20390 [Methylomonas sp. LW13]|nr:hypothetical protein CWO84_17370 [Methylomonas sp. Kb3]QBC29075.1 hypothetical protein U737_20390 [Methylomonas sp. LW13]
MRIGNIQSFNQKQQPAGTPPKPYRIAASERVQLSNQRRILPASPARRPALLCSLVAGRPRMRQITCGITGR